MPLVKVGGAWSDVSKSGESYLRIPKLFGYLDVVIMKNGFKSKETDPTHTVLVRIESEEERSARLAAKEGGADSFLDEDSAAAAAPAPTGKLRPALPPPVEGYVWGLEKDDQGKLTEIEIHIDDLRTADMLLQPPPAPWISQKIKNPLSGSPLPVAYLLQRQRRERAAAAPEPLKDIPLDDLEDPFAEDPIPGGLGAPAPAPISEDQKSAPRRRAVNRDIPHGI